MIRACAVLGFTLMLAACAPPPNGLPPSAPVTGTVKLDGKPIAKGEIHFVQAGLVPSVLEISNGTFSGKALLGQSKVEVMIFAEVESDKYPGVKTKANVAPEKYSGPQTTLDADISGSKKNELKFDLTS